MSNQIKDSVKHIVWKGTSLKVLDQRRLPHRIVYAECRTAQDVAAATRDMVLRGAPLIGCAAAYGMALAARAGSRRTLEKAAKVLIAARPTAVNLAHGVGAMLAIAQKTPDAALSRTLAAAAEKYYREDLDFNHRMAELGSGLLRKNSRVMTYCNAGSLATSGLGTALGVIRHAFQRGKIAHVFPCETRPYLQGSRLTLWELMREKIPATLITDNTAAHLMKTADIHAVIVGSDRIAANADVCNKIGTYGLAILAKHHRIPFYVVAPTTTVDLNTPDGDGIPIESRSAKEVLELGEASIAPKGAKAHHFAFDVTPHELVTAIVTEKGIVRPADAKNLRKVIHG